VAHRAAADARRAARLCVGQPFQADRRWPVSLERLTYRKQIATVEKNIDQRVAGLIDL
jgi:hypothetical protein